MDHFCPSVRAHQALYSYSRLAGKRKINLSLSLIISWLWACERKVSSFVPESPGKDGTQRGTEPCAPSRPVLHNDSLLHRKCLCSDRLQTCRRRVFSLICADGEAVEKVQVKVAKASSTCPPPRPPPPHLCYFSR